MFPSIEKTLCVVLRGAACLGDRIIFLECFRIDLFNILGPVPAKTTMFLTVTPTPQLSLDLALEYLDSDAIPSARGPPTQYSGVADWRFRWLPLQDMWRPNPEIGSGFKPGKRTAHGHKRPAWCYLKRGVKGD